MIQPEFSYDGSNSIPCMFVEIVGYAHGPKRSDVQKAKDWLKAWSGHWLTVEEIKNQASLMIGVPALARKMRLSRERGEVKSRIREGKTYMEYTWEVK